MKLTTKQLKKLIKEELEAVLNEDLPKPDQWWPVYNACMEQGIPPLNIEAGDEDGCLNLGMQIKSGNFDHDVVMAYARYAYKKKPERMSKDKDAAEVEEYLDYVAKWNEFGEIFLYTAPDYYSNIMIGNEYERIFGEWPFSGKADVRRLKRQIVKWCKKNNCDWG